MEKGPEGRRANYGALQVSLLLLFVVVVGRVALERIWGAVVRGQESGSSPDSGGQRDAYGWAGDG